MNRAGKLDGYYIPTRYPNGLPGSIPSRFYDDPAEALAAKNLAGGVIALVNKRSGRLLKEARKERKARTAAKDAEE